MIKTKSNHNKKKKIFSYIISEINNFKFFSFFFFFIFIYYLLFIIYLIFINF